MKVVLVFEDIGDRVNVQSTPKFSELMTKLEGGQQFTSAEAYAVFALRIVREESKKKDSPILMPKSRRIQ